MFGTNWQKLRMKFMMQITSISWIQIPFSCPGAQYHSWYIHWLLRTLCPILELLLLLHRNTLASSQTRCFRGCIWRFFKDNFCLLLPPQVGVLIRNITYPICTAKRTHFCAIQSLWQCVKHLVVNTYWKSHWIRWLQSTLNGFREKYTTVEVLSGIIWRINLKHRSSCSNHTQPRIRECADIIWLPSYIFFLFCEH